MKKLKLIIAREYKCMVRSKSFLLTTLLMPLLIVLCGGVPALIGYLNNAGSDTETVVVIDETGKYAPALTDTPMYHFVSMRGDSTTNAHDCYTHADGDVAAVVIIPRTMDSIPVISVYSENTINTNLKSYLHEALSDTLSRARVASYNIEGLQDKIDKSRVDVGVRSVKWDSDGNETESSVEVAIILGMALALFTYMFVLMYGAMIMNSVVEEKTNRIVEVIVSSCKPFQLMMGKIVGIGLVGLTQILIWVVLIGGLFMVGGSMINFNTSMPMTGATAQMAGDMEGSTMAAIMQGIMSIDFTSILVCFVLYFIGGYLLYAALFAAFGSAVDQASDAGQFTTPIILIMIIALYAGIACAENPNGPMAVAYSIIPFTSPVVMMVRLPYDVPLWEVAGSLLLLYVTAGFIVWIASRIYRTGILLYGKKHSVKDIFKWLKG